MREGEPVEKISLDQAAQIAKRLGLFTVQVPRATLGLEVIQIEKERKEPTTTCTSNQARGNGGREREGASICWRFG